MELTLDTTSTGPTPFRNQEEETFVFPASLEQHRYWTLAQLDPVSTASNMAISFEITGPLEVAIVERTIAELTMRHEALRTIFRVVEGQLSQIILTRPLYSFATTDLLSISTEEQPASLQATLREHSQAAIDLRTGPVLAARLIHLAPQHYVLAFTLHHIVCDGWSNGILVRDFTVIYEALRNGHEPVLPELPFQFADFSAWQTDYLVSDKVPAALNFWIDHIAQEIPALEMPADQPRSAGRSFPGNIESDLMSAELNQRLIEYCRQSGSTKHIVLLAAFQALCSRYSGQKAFLLGSTIACRTQPGMEDVVGRFANPQIIAADLGGDPTFGELEKRVRDWETSAYTHQELPFSRIVEAFQVDRAGSASQFLQVWFVYQKAFMQPQQGSEIKVTPRRSVSGGVDFDMLVSVVERAEGPRIQIEYNAKLFSPARIRLLINGYQQLLENGLHAPDTHIADLRLAHPSIDVGVNHVTGEQRSSKKTPDILFANWEQCQQEKPDEAAIVLAGTGDALSWRELCQRSDALAGQITSRIRDNASVCVIQCAPCTESIVAAVAAWKVGARILTVPARLDANQLRDVAHATSAQVVLAPRSSLANGEGGIAFEAFQPEAAKATGSTGRAPTEWLSVATGQDGDLVYPVQALEPTMEKVSLLCSTLGITSRDSILYVSPKSSGECWLDLMLALTVGARVILWDGKDKSTLQSILDRHQVTAVCASPSAWRSFLHAGWRGDKRVLALVRGELTCILPKLPGLVRSAWRVVSGEPAGDPIGLAQLGADPVESFQILTRDVLGILDDNGHACPEGAVGELATSDGRRIGLLAQKREISGVRLLGPTHKTIQMHGHRTSLGELEEALLRDSSVLEAEATVHLEDSGKPVLCAYVVAMEKMSVDVTSLRKALAVSLPAHLVPQKILSVSHLPRHLDGTLAVSEVPMVRALALEPQDEDKTSASHDPIQTALRELWADVLGLRAIDIGASFFDLGGNSLLLVRLFARINKVFSTSLPITTIFDAETVAALAAVLRKETTIRPIVVVQSDGHKQPIFLVHSYLLYQGLSRALGPGQPFYGLRETEQDGELSLQQRAIRYVREIRSVQPRGPYAIAGWCAAGPLAVEVSRELIENGEELSAVILFDSWLPGYQATIERKRQGSSPLDFTALHKKIQYHRGKLAGLTADSKLRYAKSAIRRSFRERRDALLLRHWSQLNRLSRRLQFPLPQFMHNTSLQTFSALRDYKSKSLPLAITLIRASDTREVNGADVSCGWNAIAEHGVQVLWAPGDHESMFIGKNLERTADLVRQSLGGHSFMSSTESNRLELALPEYEPQTAAL